ncbi:MAG: PAS domain S-box-containing protein [Oceanicoccus sp.]|jgi:PAS domain S-box-containing protein
MVAITIMNKVEISQSESSLEQVLLVDDNPINLQILGKTLQNSGYKLLLAESGEDAIQIAQAKQPSLILLDILMPDMDGYEVCEALKSNPETEAIAVIFLSALEDSSAKVRGFAVGGVDYISKPFQADEVVARVGNHIKIHRLEQQLARRNIALESENHQILNTVSEGIIGLDQDGRITTMNLAATVICGWSAGDCSGKQLSSLNLFDVVEGAHVPEHHTLPYHSYHMGQSAQSVMELIRCRDQRLMPVSIVSTPRPEGGAVVVLRDISEWVESEEALRLAREEMESQRQNIAHMERLSTTGAMAAGIAHEVNQPLTAISNYSRVAKRLLGPEIEQIDRVKLAELLDKLSTQSERAAQVVEQIRGFVKKPDAGLSEVNINNMLRDVIDLAEVDSRVNDVGIHFEPTSAMPSVAMDIPQIQQVALNLIRNAMEAMNDSGRNNYGVLVRSSLQSSAVMVEVIDQGVGIDDAAQAQLFTPFYTTKVGGMGVGLSICQSMIHAAGGDIAYRPNPKGGSIFYFSLPLT